MKKKKLSKGAIVLIVGLIIIAVPVIVFLAIIISASLKTGKPVFGSRFDNDLNPKISNTQTNALVSNIKNMNSVDDCNIELRSAQYRITVDVNDSLNNEEIEKLAVDVYNEVNDELPINTYFTASSTMKMYDLSISLYNYIDEDNMIYYILTKNSTMPSYSLQCVSEALDEDLAKELRGETSSNTTDNQE